jgi:hypothetical protein
VPVIALKGAFLIGAIYREVGLREMGDLDIMVRPEQLPQAVDMMRKRGYKPIQPFRIDDDLSTSHHLTPFVKEGIARIEIHWNITGPLDFHPVDPEELWQRAVSWSGGNLPALGLCPEDLLLHISFHASFHHNFRFVGLRPCCDIAAVVLERGSGLDWELLIGRARAWGWTRGVYLSLRLARDLVGAHVPESALQALHPAGADTNVLQAATEQIFVSQALPASVARLVGQEPLSARLRSIGNRFLVSRSVREPSRRPFDRVRFRLIQGGYLLRRHGRSVLQLVFKTDRTLAASAERTNSIRSWLTAADE